jgi:hypothetical protein
MSFSCVAQTGRGKKRLNSVTFRVGYKMMGIIIIIIIIIIIMNRNTFNRLFTKDGYTWNITHTAESITV